MWICNHLVVNTPLRRSGMACVLKGSHSFTCTPRVHPLMEWTIPAFAFPTKAGTHLIDPGGMEGWVEGPWTAGWLHNAINARHRELNPDTFTRLSTNQARRRLTSLIEANALTTMPDHQPGTATIVSKCNSTDHNTVQTTVRNSGSNNENMHLLFYYTHFTHYMVNSRNRSGASTHNNCRRLLTL